MRCLPGRFAASIVVLVALGASVNTMSGAHALRQAQAWIDTADPSAGTLIATNVQVHVGALDYQDPQPTGNVDVKDNGVTIGTATPSSCRGLACHSFKYAFEAGNHSLVAYYPGDSQFASVQSDPLVFSLGKLPVLGTITSSATPGTNGQLATSPLGDPVTFSAGFQLYQVPYQPTKEPTGNVAFYDIDDGDRVIGTAPLKNRTAAVTATLPLGPQTSGNYRGVHTIAARYSGDSNYTTAYPDQPPIVNVRVVDASTGTGGTVPTVSGTSSGTRSTTKGVAASSGSTVKTPTTLRDDADSSDQSATVALASDAAKVAPAAKSKTPPNADPSSSGAPWGIALGGIALALAGGGAFKWRRTRLEA
jgi:hypothetical protein